MPTNFYFDLVFQPDVIFAATPEAAAINAGEDHVLECAANNPSHIVQWEKDGVTVSYTDAIRKVPTTDNLLIRKALESDSGRYACVVLSFDRTRIAESSAELSVNPMAETIDSEYYNVYSITRVNPKRSKFIDEICLTVF